MVKADTHRLQCAVDALHATILSMLVSRLIGITLARHLWPTRANAANCTRLFHCCLHALQKTARVELRLARVDVHSSSVARLSRLANSSSWHSSALQSKLPFGCTLHCALQKCSHCVGMLVQAGNWLANRPSHTSHIDVCSTTLDTN